MNSQIENKSPPGSLLIPVALRFVFLLETLLVLVIVQENWADLSAFSDDFTPSDLPYALRLLIPAMAIYDSVLPLVIVLSLLIWYGVGVVIPLFVRRRIGYLIFVQSQIALILTAFFWVSEFKRMGFPKIAGIVLSDSWRFHTACALAIVLFLAAGVFEWCRGRKR